MHDVVFDESLFSALAYISQPYAEAMAIWPAVSYTPYATPSKEQTGNIIKFTYFEEDNLLSVTRNNTVIGNKSDDNSALAPLIREGKWIRCHHEFIGCRTYV